MQPTKEISDLIRLVQRSQPFRLTQRPHAEREEYVDRRQTFRPGATDKYGQDRGEMQGPCHIPPAVYHAAYGKPRGKPRPKRDLLPGKPEARLALVGQRIDGLGDAAGGDLRRADRGAGHGLALGPHRPTVRGPRLGRPRRGRLRPDRAGHPGDPHHRLDARAGRPADGRGGPQPFVSKTLLLLYTIAVFWYAYNLVDVIDVLVRRLARGVDSALQRHIVLLVSRSLRVFLVVVGTLFVAQSVFHQDIGAWLAGLGIAGLAVSLAAQDSLKHLFGSITILLDRSFRIGDYVISGKQEGTIEDIGFRSTKLRTPAGCLVTIPNSNLVNNPIENLSRRPNIRRVVTLLIAGRTPSEKLRQALKAINGVFEEEGIRGPVHPVIDNVERRPLVLFEDIQAGDFKVTVTYWYAPPTDPDYAAHADRVNLRIVEELQKAGVELTQPIGR